MCVFSEPAFFRNVPGSPHASSTCPGITWRLCGGLGASVAQECVVSSALRGDENMGKKHGHWRNTKHGYLCDLLINAFTFERIEAPLLRLRERTNIQLLW